MTLLQSSSSAHHPPSIPVLLLKTQSRPHDAYHDHFSTTTTSVTTTQDPDPSTSSSSANPTTASLFRPLFVPVLEHRPNIGNLGGLQQLLQSKRLAEKYGGMIFTSQRAVEAWSDVVKRAESSEQASVADTAAAKDGSSQGTGMVCSLSFPGPCPSRSRLELYLGAIPELAGTGDNRSLLIPVSSPQG